MRLTCPNCNAQYEIPDDVIPPEGSDVQCSSCGHTWFVEQSAPKQLVVEDPETPAETADTTDEASSPEAQPQAQVTTKSRVSDQAKQILQEEAKREKAARAAAAEAQLADAQTVQQDLDLDDIMSDIDAELAEISDIEETAPATASPEIAAEPEIKSVPAAVTSLPDIDDVNPSLDASAVAAKSEPTVAVPVSPKKRRRGFRLGFLTAIILAAGLVALYYYAPELTSRFPQFTDHINTYVIFVNDARQSLFRLVEDGVELIRQSGAPAASE